MNFSKIWECCIRNCWQWVFWKEGVLKATEGELPLTPLSCRGLTPPKGNLLRPPFNVTAWCICRLYSLPITKYWYVVNVASDNTFYIFMLFHIEVLFPSKNPCSYVRKIPICSIATTKQNNDEVMVLLSLPANRYTYCWVRPLIKITDTYTDSKIRGQVTCISKLFMNDVSSISILIKKNWCPIWTVPKQLQRESIELRCIFWLHSQKVFEKVLKNSIRLMDTLLGWKKRKSTYFQWLK